MSNAHNNSHLPTTLAAQMTQALPSSSLGNLSGESRAIADSNGLSFVLEYLLSYLGVVRFVVKQVMIISRPGVCGVGC